VQRIGHGAEVVAIDVGQHVVGGHRVVVRDVGGTAPARELHQVGQQLGLIGVDTDRRRRQRAQAVHAVLRRLDSHRVLDAFFGVEPEVGGGLSARRQRDEHVVGDVALGETERAGRVAIDVDAQLGCGGHLVEPHVDDPGHVADLALQLADQGEVGDGVGWRSYHLHVDRRRDAKVEHLRREVGREEKEGRLGEALRQLAAQRAHVLERGAVTGA
jgi:hypothetical protein